MAGGDTDTEAGLYKQFRQARQGDEAALERLLGTVRPLLVRTIRARVRSSVATDALAEELAQDALIRVAEGLSGCRAGTETQLRAWCRTIARRIVIDHYRRRSEERDRRVDGEVDEAALPVSSEWPIHPVERAPESGSEVDRLLGDILMEAQEVLSPGTQVVILQRLLYGDTWRAAGSEVGTTPGGAKRRYQRAVVRLREEVLRRIRDLPDRDLRRALLEKVGEHTS